VVVVGATVVVVGARVVVVAAAVVVVQTGSSSYSVTVVPTQHGSLVRAAA